MTSWRAHRRKPFDGRCDYCGARCYGRVCDAHLDLVQLERDLMPSTRNEQTPPRPLAEVAATGSERKEA